MFKKIFDKCIYLAARRSANSFLALVSFIESSFFPIPPDVMIIPMVVAKKQDYIKIFLIATLFSTLGGFLGYFIGYVFFSEIGTKIFEFYGYTDTNFLKEKFQSSDGFFSWLLILFSAGFTPLPFKLFTIFSGFIQFNLITFFFVSLVSRGLRFFVVAYFTAKFGEPFVKFLEKKGSFWFTIIGVGLIILAIIFYLAYKFYV